MDTTKIGERVYKERKKLNITREQLAEHLELSTYYIGQIERGNRSMSIETLIKLSTCLHMSLDELILGIKKEAPTNQSELQELLNKCSNAEIELITDVVKTALPHLRK